MPLARLLRSEAEVRMGVKQVDDVPVDKAGARVAPDAAVRVRGQIGRLRRDRMRSSIEDELTGLANRSLLLEQLSRAIGRAERKGAPLAALFIDLDRFKSVNDTLGHDIGDAVLINVAERLQGNIRIGDFAARWGGDEFVVIARQTQSEEAEWLAERIRSSIGGRNFVLGDGQIVRTTCSIGFAAYPLFRSAADKSNLDQIISLADGLMYEAKKQRNAWVGMLGPDEVAASFEPEQDSIEPS